MDSRLHVLHLEDDANDSSLVLASLEAGGFRCKMTRVDTQPAFDTLLEQGGFDLILADYTLPSFDGLSALKLATERRPEVPFIFVSGTLDEEIAIESLKVGATDYVFKTKMSRIVPSVRRALREADERIRRAAAEKSLLAAQAELAHVARAMTVGELAASLAHEINQPIAAVVLNAETCARWLRRDPPDLTEARGAASRTVDQATRIADIVDRIRSLYARGTPRREQVDVNAIVRNLVALLRHEADRHSVTLRTALDGDLPTITADHVQLQQALMNLMLNAIESMRETGGEATVTSSMSEDGYVYISVSDSGVGLPAGQDNRIFDAFFTTKPHGTGMGLAISRTVVEAHGGRLWASPGAAGRGATFQLTLPADDTAPSPTPV